MLISIIAVPYDSAWKNRRMGAGPQHLLDQGIETVVQQAGGQVRVQQVQAEDEFQTEIHTSFGLYQQVARQTKEAVDAHQFPLVLAGNCGVALGVTAGLSGRVGVLWFDAHGDFHTPETSQSGFLDGMGLATLTGHCWSTLAASIPGFRPVQPTHVVHVGGRAFEPAEEAALHAAGVCLVTADAVETDTFEKALARLQTQVDQVYVHIDLDVLDKRYVGSANSYAVEGGLKVEALEAALLQVKRLMPIGAVTFASYDPSADTTNQVSKAALRLVKSLL
ncbi:arginase family protein [Hymenobacter tibetensis]|uniref:Arginase family protein n=1 Tax=Hymenobacter tibetensis TaxID=497967 RepID=A0ABY4CVW9_9BACT|nr:arginase family protein [Hymenobacter tibetensis]UOG73136.1 arginase family protein [Hymenobacter tibetensis]